MSRVVLTVFLLFGLLTHPWPVAAVELQPIVPGKVLIELHASVRGRAGAERVATGAGARLEKILGRGRFAVLNTGGRSSRNMARDLAGSGRVAAASPVFRRRLAPTFPDDPAFSTHQWALHNTGQTISFPSGAAAGLPDADIDAPEAWDLTTGSVTVIAAVIDTGIALGNGILVPNLWVNPGELPADGLDNDGNGYIDDLHGYNFAENTANPNDTNGHGSFCAGIIGGRGNDGATITGINWQLSLMALKAFGPDGTSTDIELIEAIEYAADNGARVVNASWGDPGYSPVLDAAIRSAGERGVLFVAAVGNDGSNLTENPFYPAASPLPNLVSVGASGVTDSWAGFSNYDDTVVDLFAPGENVCSTRVSSVGFGSGTSYAAPHVAGVAALMLAKDPGLSVAALRSRLKACAEPRPGLADRTVSDGRVSAWRALTAAGLDSAAPAPVSDLSVAETATNGFAMRWSAPGDDGASGQAHLYDIRISTAAITSGNFLDQDRVRSAPSPGEPGAVQQVAVTGREPGTTYYVRMVASDDAGNTSPLSNELVVSTQGATTLFSDSMESGSGQWSVTGSFALTTETARSGSWCWSDSPLSGYSALTSATLTSVPFSLAGASRPWLRFYNQHFFDDSVAALRDSVQVQVTTDSVSYTTLHAVYDWTSPWRPVFVDLYEYTGQPSVRLRFLFQSDNVQQSDGWYMDDLEVFDAEAFLPEPPDLTLESKDPFATRTPPAYVESSDGGNWLDSSSKSVDAHVRSLRARYYPFETSPLNASARFTPLFSADGLYEVMVIWGMPANAANVRYVVKTPQGSATRYLSQNGFVNGNQWHSLGMYRFGRGRSAEAGSVTVDVSSVTGKPNGSTEGRVYADGVRFVYRGVDQTDSDHWMLYD